MTEEQNKAFLERTGSRLKAVRKKKSFTQKQTADALGVTQSYLSAVENGKKLFSTGFIIELIKFYGVPYEMIFDQTNPNVFDIFKKTKNTKEISQYVELLMLLIENTESPNLELGVTTYLKMCIYWVFRELYCLNPRNSDTLLGLTEDQASYMAEKMIRHTPEQLARFVNRCHIDKKKLEVPIEKSCELREFIKECELFLLNINI